MVVGLTGKYCSGKSTAAGIMEERGCRIIDVDKLGHEALEDRRDELAALFGNEILQDGHIDRKRLGEIVFSDRTARLKLEGTVHPVMVRRCRQLIEAYEENRDNRAEVPGVSSADKPAVESDMNTESCTVLNAALLHYMGLDELCDAVLYVHAPWRVRFRRAKKRDGTSLRSFLRRNRAQRLISPRRLSSRGGVYIVKNRDVRGCIDPRISEQIESFFSSIRKENLIE